MRYAIIENGLVANVVVADANLASENGWVDCPVAGPGWTYVNGVFTAPPEAEVVAPATQTKEELMAELTALTAKIQALL